MKQLPPHNLVPSTTNGDVLVTLGGVAAWGHISGPLVPVTTDVDGDFGFVWLDDGQLVMTEVTG